MAARTRRAQRPDSDLEPAAAFAGLLARTRVEVDRRLLRVWDRQTRAVKRYERGVRAMVAAARDLTVRGGKRFRPALLLSVYRGLAPDADLEPALRAASPRALQSYCSCGLLID